MGFYFRKSKSFGFFRLNFSKSGIGFSTGVKGARMSFGPKGTYVNLGSNGVFYRKKIGSESREKSNYNTYDVNAVSTVNIITESLVKTEFEKELLSNIKKAQIFDTLWIIAFIISCFLICITSLFVLLTIALIVLRIILKDYFRANINYEFDEEAKNRWRDFLSSVELLKTGKKVWLIESKANVLDQKHSAGAGENVKRSIIKSIKQINPQKNNSAKVKCDNPIIQIITRKCKIIFLPNLIVVISNGNVTGYSYENLKLSSSTTRFIENSSVSVPKDSQIVDWTWQYVNRNGGPDMRYKQNPKMPVCKYGTLKLFTENGFLLEFHISNSNISGILESGWNDYIEYITKVLCANNKEKPKLENTIDAPKISKYDSSEKIAADNPSSQAYTSANLNSKNRLINEIMKYVSTGGEFIE